MSLAESLIADRLYKLKLSKAQLATLTGIATQRLIPGLRGVVKLSNVEFERIYATLDEVEKLIEIAKPFALPTDVSEIKTLVEKMRGGEFDNKKTAVEV